MSSLLQGVGCVLDRGRVSRGGPCALQEPSVLKATGKCATRNHRHPLASIRSRASSMIRRTEAACWLPSAWRSHQKLSPDGAVRRPWPRAGCTSPRAWPAGRWPGRPGLESALARSAQARPRVTLAGRRDSALAPGRVSWSWSAGDVPRKPCCGRPRPENSADDGRSRIAGNCCSGDRQRSSARPPGRNPSNRTGSEASWEDGRRTIMRTSGSNRLRNSRIAVSSPALARAIRS